MSISIVKGTKDILPQEVYKWQHVEKLWREICARYGFTEFRTPIFEHTELFQRGIGDTTDVVQKEMYTFTISDRSLTLKPEGTSPVVRSFIENKLYTGQLPAKYYYITPCFRYEKMQKGRQRQFHQFGIEIFGSDTMLADAEVISLGYEFLKACGLDDVKLHINSIGCPTCRSEYRKALQDYLRPNLDRLCDTCRGRFDRNPMRILDCKSPVCQSFAADAPRMLNFLCDDCKNAFEELKTDLDALQIPYEVDPGIVRGLDYYTKTAFEFVSDKLGAQSTVCGGGRYDNLVEEVGGPKTAGVGFGLGIERLLLIMEASAAEPEQPKVCDVFVAALGENARPKALQLVSQLRKAGLMTQMDLNGRGLKAQMKYADRLHAKYCIMIGDDELQKGVAVIRDMSTSSQTEAAFESIIDHLTI
ncbi:MAG: histidine--tRNA ligase [Firmicutes bacterium]|nr:histidine--tRNA ligase [Bacillota bacterium]